VHLIGLPVATCPKWETPVNGIGGGEVRCLCADGSVLAVISACSATWRPGRLRGIELQFGEVVENTAHHDGTLALAARIPPPLFMAVSAQLQRSHPSPPSTVWGSVVHGLHRPVDISPSRHLDVRSEWAEGPRLATGLNCRRAPTSF
jgi:hypothetical protein